MGAILFSLLPLGSWISALNLISDSLVILHSLVPCAYTWTRVLSHKHTPAHIQRDCPSGQLSKKKFIEVYSGFFPDGNAEEFCTHVFRTFDKDNSGRIDFKEFLLAINITSGGDPEEKLEWAYQMYDIDGNGTIERTEMVEIIRVSFSIFFILLFFWSCWKCQVNRQTCHTFHELINCLTFPHYSRVV